jgi:hypothetical protein
MWLNLSAHVGKKGNSDFQSLQKCNIHYKLHKIVNPEVGCNWKIFSEFLDLPQIYFIAFRLYLVSNPTFEN